MIVCPTGTVVTVTLIAFCVNVAVSVIGPFIVMFTGLVAPVNAPVPDPVHPPKLYPEMGVALMFTISPGLRHPLAGRTDPPVPATIVRKYCVEKLAVYVPFARGAMLGA